MLIQVHMLQSFPPGNLNRDDTGQPKHCLFGNVTRGRISSQCLKRNIRLSEQMRDALGERRAERTVSLPKLLADAIKALAPDFAASELEEIKVAVAAKFKSEKKRGAQSDDEDAEESESAESESPAAAEESVSRTGQLVFFPPQFTAKLAEMLLEFRAKEPEAYAIFLGRKLKLAKEDKARHEKTAKGFPEKVSAASKATITPDIALFGRMTTSEMVVNVEASLQMAHAISTHEMVIEGDYFTAMDDLSTEPGAAFMGSGDTVTYFNSSVYYRYFNVNIDGLKSNLRDAKPPVSDSEIVKIAARLVTAAAFTIPTGKQNSFAAHSYPEFILVEVSGVKRPLNYMNAFLQPVRGGTESNLMTESAETLVNYIGSVAAAFAPADTKRFYLAVGNAQTAGIPGATRLDQIETLERELAAVASKSLA